MAKSSQLDFDKRVRNVQEWMMLGYSTADIVRQCVSQWNITERMGYKYIRKAYEVFRAHEEKDSEALRQYHIQARLKLFRDLTDKKESKPAGVALSILQDIAKLQGMYVDKIDHTTGGKPFPPPVDTKHEVVFMNYQKDAEV